MLIARAAGADTVRAGSGRYYIFAPRAGGSAAAEVLDSEDVVYFLELDGYSAMEMPVETVSADQVDSANVTNVNASASSVTLLAPNAVRKGGVVVNDSATATLYLKYGGGASTTSYTYRLDPGATWEMPGRPVYTGQIDGVWSAASGAARVTEL
jgi:hypothetical protein